jgi:hypothetical protein
MKDYVQFKQNSIIFLPINNFMIIFSNLENQPNHEEN